jgi:hypothetical protein
MRNAAQCLSQISILVTDPVNESLRYYGRVSKFG